MTSEVSYSTALNQQGKTQNATSKLAEDFSQFLTLLTTQLQNQDPLSPMDTTEFTNQLVMFSGVEQQINTNQKLDSLVSLGLSNSFTSALDYVGLEVSFIGSEIPYSGSGDAKMTYALAGQAVDATIRIVNEDGKTVYTADAETSAGAHEFTWDGTMTAGGTAPAGTYSVVVDALDINDKPVESSTVVSGLVRGIETQDGQLFALVGERAVPIANILNASVPKTATATTEPETPAT